MLRVALPTREVAILLDRISPRIAAHADLGLALADFVEYTVEAARREEIIGLLFGSDEELAGVGLAAGTSTCLFEIVTEFLRPVFTRHWRCVEPASPSTTPPSGLSARY